MKLTMKIYRDLREVGFIEGIKDVNHISIGQLARLTDMEELLKELLGFRFEMSLSDSHSGQKNESVPEFTKTGLESD